MIRKEGKARWTYTCGPCEVRVTHPDQFRAIEACHRHERSYGHAASAIGKVFRDAFTPLMQAFGWPPRTDAQDAIAREIWRSMR